MMKRGQNQRRRAWQNCDSAVSADVQCLDGRQLLVVNVLAPQIGLIAGTDQHSVTLRWEDADHDSAQAYHVWVDQQVNGTTVISKVYVNDRVTVSGAASSLTIPFSLQSGNYALSVRRISGSGRSPWTEPYAFTIDSRIGNQTGSSAELVPPPPAITVIREGQGYFGQASSEPALGWSSATVMHNVLLCRRATDGSWQRLADLRSVPGHVVTQRQLAQAAASSAANKAVFYGDLTSQSSVAGLAEGSYRLWVQSLNGDVNASGTWTGRSSWSVPVDFSVVTLTGSEVAPGNLKIQNGIRPVFSWDAIVGAEFYSLSLQQVTDDSRQPVITIPVYGNQFIPSSRTISGGGGTIQLLQGATYRIRVRANDQYGTEPGFRSGNHSAGILTIPVTLPDSNILPPVVRGPFGRSFDAFPVLSWDHQPNAESYEVWLSDLQLNRRVLLKTQITDNFLRLDLDAIRNAPGSRIDSLQRWSSQTGLEDGSYRFWVRSVAGGRSNNTGWTRGVTFTIESHRRQKFSELDGIPVSRTPLVNAGHLLRLNETGVSSIVIGTGGGESSGPSVVARYQLTDNSDFPWQRPVKVDPQTGMETLQYEDLAIGKNISDMKLLPNGWIAATCRNSADLFIVDPVEWKVVSRFDFSDAQAPDPEPMGFDILPNGGLVVALRSRRPLRVLDVAADGTLTEAALTVPAEQVTSTRMINGVFAAAAEDGSVTCFLNSSDLRGTVILKYSPVTRGFSLPDSATTALVSRNSASNPLNGGAVIRVSTENGNETEFFTGVDRNGFLTWIDTASLRSGFIDLAEFLPGSSRDPTAPGFISPNDNGVDSVQVKSVGDHHIFVGNLRANSLLLRVSMSSGGQLVLEPVQQLRSASAASVVSEADGITLLTLRNTVTASAGNLLTDRFELSGYDLIPVMSDAQQLSGSLHAPAVIDPLRIAVKNSDGQIEVVSSAPTNTGLRILSRTKVFSDSIGQQYRTDSRVMATYRNRTSGTATIFSTGFRIQDPGQTAPAPNTPTELLILSVDALGNLHLQAAIALPAPNVRAYSMSATESSVTIMDRFRGREIIVNQWASATPGIRVVDFAKLVPSQMGASRPASSITLNPQTRVILHDTSPDTGFTVIRSGSENKAPLHFYHAQSTGRSLWTIRRLDDDRIVGITFDGRLLIFNTATGVFEANIALDVSGTQPIGVAPADFVSVSGNLLAIGSKVHERVSVFELRNSGVGSQQVYSVTLIHVIQSSRLVGVELAENTLWITEAQQIHRIAL